MYSHRYIHSYRHILTRTETNTCRHIYTPSHTDIYWFKQTHTITLIRNHTHRDTCMITDTDACIHTQVHTNSYRYAWHMWYTHTHTHPLQELFHSPGSPSQGLCLNKDPETEYVSGSQVSPGLVSAAPGLQDCSSSGYHGPAQTSLEQGYPCSRTWRTGNR